jgi:protein-disulfide isomerase
VGGTPERPGLGGAHGMQGLRRALVAGLLAAAVLTGCGGKSSTPAAPSSPEVSLPSLDEMLADKVMGAANAAVTMIEYSSAGCSHCSDFHRLTLPMIKSDYIDPGQVRLVYRDYPLDTRSLSAAMVARCAGDRFFAVLGRLYETQATWTSASDLAGALGTVVSAAGADPAIVQPCLANTTLRDGVLAIHDAGARDFGVNGTPTFIINGQTLVGAWPYTTFATIFQQYLQQP